jgi:uncharacterized protein
MHSFTPIASLTGGALIGLAAALLLITNGRIAGVSGVVGGLMTPSRGDVAWRVLFIAGLVAGANLLWVVRPGAFSITVSRSAGALVVAGVLVGFGTRLSNGCTSGHGVCGVSRLSPRSLAATATFMAGGALSTFVVQHLLGGRL